MLAIIESMEPANWVALLAVCVSLLTAILTTSLALLNLKESRRRELEQVARETALRAESLERERAMRSDQLAREDARSAEQRALIPRVEYDLQCHFHGPQEGDWATDLQFIVNNKGAVRREFGSIKVRLRIIRRNEVLKFWGEGFRLRFPEQWIQDDLLPQHNDYYYFVEPGVRQVFSYPTKIPMDASFVLLHVSFRPRSNKREAPFEDLFVEERMFPVPAST